MTLAVETRDLKEHSRMGTSKSVRWTASNSVSGTYTSIAVKVTGRRPVRSDHEAIGGSDSDVRRIFLAYPARAPLDPIQALRHD